MPLLSFTLRTLPLLAALAAPLAAADGTLGKPVFRIAPAVWYATLDGSWGLSSGGNPVDKISSDELNADDYVFGGFIEGNIGLPWIMDLEFGGMVFSTDGDNAIEDDFTFGDANFGIGDEVESEAFLADVYAGLSFRLVDTPKGWVSIGTVVHLISGEVTMKSATDSDTVDEAAVVPAITARAAISVIPTLTVGTALQWMSLTVADAEVDLVDIQAYVEWKPFGAFGVIAGYRYFDVAVAIDDDDEPSAVDATIGGPFAGLVASF